MRSGYVWEGGRSTWSGGGGWYWPFRTLVDANLQSSFVLNFDTAGVYPSNIGYNRFHGQSLRCLVR